MADKKNVAIVLHGLGANGIDSLFANLSGQWDLRKFNITYLIAVDPEAEQFWEAKVKGNGVRVIHLHDLDKGRLKKWPVTLFRALKTYGPFDVVHMNMDMLNGLNLFLAKKVGIKRRVCHAHRSASKNAESKLKKIYIYFMKKLMKLYATDRVACSELAGNYFYDKRKNYEIVYNGIEIEKYLGNKEKKEKIMPIFATVGRISIEKNPFFLIDVFKEILKIKPGAKMRWIGNGGSIVQDVKKYAEELKVIDKIEFMGNRSDVNQILKTCDYFLFPSVFEGFGLAVAEAQIAGLDCFASDRIPEVADLGKAKFISLDKESKEWAMEICQYIDGEESMQLISENVEKLDIKYMARTLEEIYCNS